MSNQAIQSFQKDKLRVKIFKNEVNMGAAAADFVTENLNVAIAERGSANLILATGTSQFTFLEAFKKKVLNWDKITVFHLDEYKGISEHHPASFRKYLKDRILDIVKPGKVYLINGEADDLEQEIERYETILKKHPIDVACIGIGENGHIAFNDPPVANFHDVKWVKEVELDEACRLQQLNEGWFSSFEQVPRKAVTLTITAIMKSKIISCVVPGKQKSEAIYNTLNGSVTTNCPATILRNHHNVTLYLDILSASHIKIT